MIVHLHTPMGRTYCGAPVPADRARGLTAYRSDATCPECVGGLRPDRCAHVLARGETCPECGDQRL